MIRVFAIGVFTALAAYCGVLAILSWATRREVFDIPNDRSSHETPTPRGGGLVMVVLTLAGVLVFGIMYGEVRTLWWYLIGGALIAIVSWFDDLQDLPSTVRFAVHGIGALLAIEGFGYWQSVNLPFLSTIGLGWAGLAVTFVWVVGLTNAFNFMDGVDGIAGLQAVVAGLAWMVFGWWTDQSLIVVIGLMVSCSSLGFLLHNWSPARIFMGDVSSAFLGFTFAALPLMAARNGGVQDRWMLASILVMWPFVFDTTLTLIRRLLRGENVLKAHRSHLYQRLVIVGMSHAGASSLYGVFALLSALIGAAWLFNIRGSEILAAVAPLMLGLGLWRFTIGQERRHAATIAGLESLAQERP
ncbi:MAG: glycosyltransferase family 4 protein [Pyrinomonadaceae bacterium]